MRSLPTVLVVLVSAAAFGLYVAVPPAAIPEFADTEVSTNIPVNVVRSDVRSLDVSVELCATPSNNVQVAFGRDADGDGILSPEESDLVLGWDCGRWFAEETATGWMARSGMFVFFSPAKSVSITAIGRSAASATGFRFRRSRRPTCRSPTSADAASSTASAARQTRRTAIYPQVWTRDKEGNKQQGLA